MFTIFTIFVLSLGNAQITTTPSRISISLEMPEVKITQVLREGNFYTELGMEGAGIGLEFGRPKLPVIRKCIEIPEDAQARVEVTVKEKSMVLKYPILPLQPPVPKIEGATVEFTIDTDFYARDAFSPAKWAKIIRIGYIRGRRVAWIEIYPVRYNPNKNIIHYAKDVDVVIKLIGSNMAKTDPQLRRYYSLPFENMASKIIDNYGAFWVKSPPQLPVGYLIICADDYYSNILPFAEWKKKKGFHTVLTKTSEIPGGVTVTNITNYIEEAYDNWTPPPTYVLLVGDVDEIPAHEGSVIWGITDLYYATTAGTDFIPDLYIGRFPIASASQADILVEKIMDYERNLWTQGTEWLGRMYFMASNDGMHHDQVEAICNRCMTLARTNGVECDSLYAYYGTGTPISTAINDGRVIALYTGHGGTTGWGGPSFGQSDVNNLTNLDKYPFVVSHACLTGDFEVSECFGETWVRVADKGACAFFGSVPSTYWVDDDTLQWGWFESMFGSSPTNFIGGFTQIGLYRYYEWGGENSTPHYYYEAYHIFGDPSQDIYTNVPESLTVSYPGLLPMGSDEFTVQVAQDSALVALYRDSTLYGSGYSSGGEVTMNLDPIPTEEGFMQITVMKHNYFTYEDSVPVLVPAQVTIEPDSVPVDVATWVDITVLDDIGNPMPDIEVSISGWGIEPPLIDTTDENGSCSIKVDAPYGEVLEVKGRMLTESWTLFTEPLWVIEATDFLNPSLIAWVPEIGWHDTLASWYEGIITGETGNESFTILVKGCGLDTFAYVSGDSGDIAIVPSATGTVSAVLCKELYNIYEHEFTVNQLYGTLSGVVMDSVTSEVLGGACISGYRLGDTEPFFEVITNEAGEYTITDSIPVEPYIIYATSYGYEDYSDTIMILVGANVYDIDLVPGEMVSISGVVNLKGAGDNSGVSIVAMYKGYSFSDESELTGSYNILVPPGAAYTVTASKEGYTLATKEAIDVPIEGLNFVLYPVTTCYRTNFEVDNGGMTSNGDWEWGIPTHGPDSAHSGEKLWATGLTGDYSNSSNSMLNSPMIYLPEAASYIRLTFWHWYDMEDYWDGGNVKLSANGGLFNIITPEDGYPEVAISGNNAGIPGEPAFSDDGTSWTQPVFDITPYVGDTVQIRFHFGSDGSVTEPGWYIDDVWVGYIDSTGGDFEDIGLVGTNLPDTVYKDSSYTPIATIYNFGNTTYEVPVVCCIGDYWDQDTVEVLPDSGCEATFSAWIPTIADTTYMIEFVISVVGDQYSGNDTLHKEVYVSPYTGVAHLTSIPMVYSLSHARPNPFGPKTMLKYGLPKESQVSLKIYNILGQQIATLVNERQQAGYYTLCWDGKTSNGKRIAQGIYFLRLKADTFMKTHKLVVLK